MTDLTPLITAIIGGLATIFAAYITSRREGKSTDAKKPTPRPGLLFVSTMALGIGLTALVIALMPVINRGVRTDVIQFEIASEGMGTAQNRVLIPDASHFHSFSNDVRDTFGRRVLFAELHMLKDTGPTYWGYLKATIDPNHPNRIGLEGAMKAGNGPFQAVVTVWYEQ